MSSTPYLQQRRSGYEGPRQSSFPIMLCCHPKLSVCTSAALACKTRWSHHDRVYNCPSTSPALRRSCSLPSASILPARGARTSAGQNQTEHWALSPNLHQGDRSVNDWSPQRLPEEAALRCKAAHGNASGPWMPLERLFGWTWDRSGVPVHPSPPAQWHDPAMSPAQMSPSACTEPGSGQNMARGQEVLGPESRNRKPDKTNCQIHSYKQNLEKTWCQNANVQCHWDALWHRQKKHNFNNKTLGLYDNGLLINTFLHFCTIQVLVPGHCHIWLPPWRTTDIY